MKRKISLVLAAALVTGSLPLSVQAATFRDLQETPWAASAITSAVDKKLLSGYADGTFRGNRNVTKTECMTMLYNVVVNANFLQKMQTDNISVLYGAIEAAHIPDWASTPVLYGLGTGILELPDVMRFYENGSAKEATREEVAIMFGKALESKYDTLHQKSADFIDRLEISHKGMPYVNLLARLGIVSGDQHKRFQPKKPITRAEMAVMVNKTYALLADEQANQGEITEIVNHNGDYYDLTIHMDNGETLKFAAMNDNTGIYNKDGSREISLSQFAKGDRVSLVYEGGYLKSIYLLSQESSPQSRFDVTGYTISLKDRQLTLANENTGETQKYTIDSNVICYLDGKKTTYAKLEELTEENYNQYIYTGLMLDSETVKEGRENVQKTKVKEVYMTVSDTYTSNGQVESVTENKVTFKEKEGLRKTVYYQNNCAFYLGEEKENIANIIKIADTETLYVKVYMDKAQKATKVVFSADSFTQEKKEKTKMGTLIEFSDRRMSVLFGGEKITYSFKSDHPLDNIFFYTWDSDSREWVESSFKQAEKVYDNTNDDVYCRVHFNDGGKLSAVYVSENRSVFKESSGAEETRKGTVVSIEDGILKFKASSQPYKMLNQYNVKKKIKIDGTEKEIIRNELNILGAVTSSSVVLQKMANSPDTILYAEIVADEDHVVQRVKEAYLTYAKGKLVEYDAGSDPHMIIETSDGAQIDLKVMRNPATGSNDYTWEDIATTNYIGEVLELGFNSNGEVSKITAVNGTPLGSGKRVEGMAAGATGGLKLEGDNNVYDWTSSVTIRSKSFDYEHLYTLKDLINDPDVRLHIHANLSDTDRVEVVNATVKSAKGKLDEYSHSKHTIRFITNAGNTFTLNTIPSPINNASKGDLEKLTEEWQGKNVSLEFNSDGLVTTINP